MGSLDEDTFSRDDFMSLDVPPEAAPPELANAEATLRLIHASKRPLFSRREAALVIDAAAQTARELGWTTDRHVHAPTCDVPAHALPAEAVRWVALALRRLLAPAAAALFPATVPDASLLRCQDCFVVRYDGDETSSSDRDASAPGFASLRPHQDESVISMSVCRRAIPSVTYAAVGRLPAWCSRVSAAQPSRSTTAPSMRTAGYGSLRRATCSTGTQAPCSALRAKSCTAAFRYGAGGTRWIMTVFFYVDTNASGREPGYALRAVSPDASSDDT